VRPAVRAIHTVTASTAGAPDWFRTGRCLASAEEADMLTLESRTEELRRQAIERIKKRSEFWSHLAAFLLFNALIITIWFAVADGGFFWPIFPLAGSRLS
jgi:hypothetical protein